MEGADATEVASTWRDGLAGWGIDGSRVQALRDAADFSIYTPGSSAGVGLNVIGGLQRPPDDADPEAVVDEVQGFVSGLLGLVGIDADPMASREHVLLSNLVHNAWATGTDLDLAGLVAQVLTPPIRKLGVFEIDEFFPPGDRTDLAMRLNGLLASPTFAAWQTGETIDIDRMLRPDGRTGCAIVSLSHLGDEERQLVVTLLLSKLVTWMRRQPGTDQLRALVYFDEVAGFVPPSCGPAQQGPDPQPPQAGPGLRGRAGPGHAEPGRRRLQGTVERRHLDDRAPPDRAGQGPPPRRAVGRRRGRRHRRGGRHHRRPRQAGVRPARTGSAAPVTFTTRWAMSYLRGPLTHDQISTLMADRRSAPAAAADEALAVSTAPASPPTAGAPPVGPTATDPDVTPVMPAVTEGLPVRWLDPAAPWAAQIGAEPMATTFEAAISVAVELLFDDDKADLRETERFEAVLHPLSDPPDMASLVTVDHDPRDFRTEAPAGATYRIPRAPVKNKGFASALSKDLVAHLYANRTTTLPANPELKLYGRPGETEEAFAARCEAAADDGADKAAAALTKKFEARITRARTAVATAEDRLDQAEEAQSSRRSDEFLSGAGELLGSLLGGRSARGVSRSVGAAARRRGRSSEASTRVDSASNRVEEKRQALADLEADMADELGAIADEWDAKAAAVTTMEVPLEKSDIRVVELALVWVPVA